VPTTTVSEDTAVYDGTFIPSYNFITSPGAVTNWTNSNPSIGVGASGAGTVPSFVATNRSDADIVGTITATPVIGGCSGAAQSYTIKVMPLNKDVFVPNVFTPNGDGKNDLLYVYGNYIDKVEMHIFNQWGQQLQSSPIRLKAGMESIRERHNLWCVCVCIKGGTIDRKNCEFERFYHSLR
jgi:hypothetical protein